MKISISFFILLLAIILGCNGKKSQNDDWKEIKSKDGHFKICFPDFEVKNGQETYLVGDTKKVISFYSLNTQYDNDENLGYRVDFSLWPEFKNDSADEIFNYQRDLILSTTSSKLLYEKIIDTKDYPGREWYFGLNNRNIKIKYRIYFNSGTLYKLMVITSDDRLFNNSIAKFLDSFDILEKEE